MSRHPKQEKSEISTLLKSYHSQISEVSACEQVLSHDQSRFLSYITLQQTSNSIIVLPPRIIDILEKGMKLRIGEFNEDVRRLMTTERKIHELIERRGSLIGTDPLTEAKFQEKLDLMQRIVDRQNKEMQQLRFERDTLTYETLRLKQKPDNDLVDFRSSGIFIDGRHNGGIGLPINRYHLTDERQLKETEEPKQDKNEENAFIDSPTEKVKLPPLNIEAAINENTTSDFHESPEESDKNRIGLINSIWEYFMGSKSQENEVDPTRLVKGEIKHSRKSERHKNRRNRRGDLTNNR